LVFEIWELNKKPDSTVSPHACNQDTSLTPAMAPTKQPFQSIYTGQLNKKLRASKPTRPRTTAPTITKTLSMIYSLNSQKHTSGYFPQSLSSVYCNILNGNFAYLAPYGLPKFGAVEANIVTNLEIAFVLLSKLGSGKPDCITNTSHLIIGKITSNNSRINFLNGNRKIKFNILLSSILKLKLPLVNFKKIDILFVFSLKILRT
jgi:hypothetical protein